MTLKRYNSTLRIVGESFPISTQLSEIFNERNGSEKFLSKQNIIFLILGTINLLFYRFDDDSEHLTVMITVRTIIRQNYEKLKLSKRTIFPPPLQCRFSRMKISLLVLMT